MKHRKYLTNSKLGAFRGPSTVACLDQLVPALTMTTIGTFIEGNVIIVIILIQRLKYLWNKIAPLCSWGPITWCGAQLHDLLTCMTSVSHWSGLAWATPPASLHLSTFPSSCQWKASSSSLRSLVTRGAHHAEPAPGHSLSACCVGNSRLVPFLHWTEPLPVGFPHVEHRPPLRLCV